jgi:hypothetical protein
MSQMVGTRPVVNPNGLPHQSIRVVPEFVILQRLHRWSDTVDDGTKVSRLRFGRATKLLQSGKNRSTAAMAQDHDEPCVEALGGKLDAADLRRGGDISCRPDDN